MLTVEDLNNLLVLIAKATIMGAEAVTVAVLQQKIQALIVEMKSPKPPENKGCTS